MTVHNKNVPTRERRDGQGAARSDPSGLSKGSPLSCDVNGVNSQALFDMGAEVRTYNVPLRHTLTNLNPHKSVSQGQKNMPLYVAGKTEVNIQFGGIRAQHRVLVCRGFAQQ